MKTAKKKNTILIKNRVFSQIAFLIDTCINIDRMWRERENSRDIMEVVERQKLKMLIIEDAVRHTVDNIDKIYK